MTIYASHDTIGIMQKLCKYCGILKNLNGFYKWNKTRCIPCMVKYAYTQKQKNPVRNLYDRIKYRAKRKHIPFNLKLEDIIIPEICPVLGIPLSINYHKHPADNSPSVDRIIPSKGYIKENIIIISNKANRIKTDATAEEIDKVAKFYLKLSTVV